MERSDLVVKSLQFLQKITDIKQQTPDIPILYLDETWLNQNHIRSHIWQDSNNGGILKVLTEKGARLILLNISSAKTGFIPQCKLLYKNTKNTDSDSNCSNTDKEDSCYEL